MCPPPTSLVASRERAPTGTPETARRPQDPGRIHDEARSAGIDGLRGLAALTVFLFHLFLYGRIHSGTHARLGTWSLAAYQLRLGLICFFVLTGFLLFRSFLKAARRQQGPVSFKRYVERRAARILPAYYVAMIGAYLMLRGAAGTPGVKLPHPGDLWKFALLAQNYFPDTILRLDSVTWTLSIELAFYALLPFLGLFAYYVARGRIWVLLALLAAMIAVGLNWHYQVFENGFSQVYSKSLPHYLPDFAFGMLAALLVQWRDERRVGPLRRLPTAALMLVGVALVGFNCVWHATSASPAVDQAVALFEDMPAALGFACAVVAASTGVGPAVAWLRARPLASLGIVSYGFYLWHVPLILFGQSLGFDATGFGWMLLVFLPVTLAFATASWRLVEKPIIARVHRRPLVAGGARGPSTAAAAP